MNNNQNNLHNFIQFHNKLTIKMLNNSIQNDIMQKEEYIDYYVVQSKILTFISNMPLSYRAILEQLIMKDMSLKISKLNFFADVASTYTPGFISGFISGFKNSDSNNPQYSFFDVDLNFKLMNMQREDIDIISASFDFLDPERSEKTKGVEIERVNEFDFDLAITKLLNFEDVIEKLDDFANPISAHYDEDYDDINDEYDDDDDDDFDEDDIFIGTDY